MTGGKRQPPLSFRALNRSERVIVAAMWFIGISTLFAWPAVVLPFSWMAEIHQWVGLGEMPDTPIVRYLARSLSSFYGILGILTLALVQDVRRYRPIVRLWIAVVPVTGIVLLAIDIEAGMPLSWTLTEGIPPLVLTPLLWWCGKRIESE